MTKLSIRLKTFGRNLISHQSQPNKLWVNYVGSLITIAICTALAQLVYPLLERSNLMMLYLLAVVLIAVRFGRGPSVLASLVAVAAFDFFYVPPYLTFAVADPQDLITFGVMLAVAILISSLTGQIRLQAEVARERERETATLYSMSRELARTRGQAELQKAALQHLKSVFDYEAALLLPTVTDGDTLETVKLAISTEEAATPEFLKEEAELGVARWVYKYGKMAGRGMAVFAKAQAFYLPLLTSQRTVGVLAMCPRTVPQGHTAVISPQQLHLLENFATQIALTLERDYLTEETRRSQVQIETEQMRNSLLSSISHDLRTPLATITGSVSSLLEAESSGDEKLSRETRKELLTAVYEEAGRLNRLVANLLEMTRLESGAIKVKKEWQPLEEVIGTALARLENSNPNFTRNVAVNLPPDLPLVPLDEVLIEQVLINLLENALKYTPPDSPIEITAAFQANQKQIIVRVADQGPGLPPGEEELIFGKFYRAKSGQGSGAGLGLTICRGIVAAHGGQIWATNRLPAEGLKGALFNFTLPLEGQPPLI